MRTESTAGTDRPAPLGASAPTHLTSVDRVGLFADQIEFTRRNVPIAMVGSLVNVAVLAYVLWPLVPRATMLGWLGAVGALAVLRALHSRAYIRMGATHEGRRRWTHQFIAGTAVSGLAWASVCLAIPEAALSHQVFAAFLTGGLSAGAMAAYSSIAWLPHAFIVPATGLVALSLALGGGPLAMIMAGMIVVFGALLSVMASGLHGTVLTGLRLRQENRSLVAYFADAKMRAERLNEDLKAGIRDRLQAEQALRESEERFRSLVERATDGIGFTFEGRIHYANKAALDLIGYEAEEVLGLPIERFLARTTNPDDNIYQRYQDRMAGQDVPQHYETQMVRKDGTILDVMFSNSLVSLDGKAGVMSLVKDITERKRIESELRAAKEVAEEATRLKDQFVSLLAHDLRAPLNSILSMIAVLGDDAEQPLPPEQRDVLRAVLTQGEATLRMIEDLLSVSRVQTGKLKPDPHFVDAVSITAMALGPLKPLAEKKRITVRDEVPHRTRLHTDAELFSKVLYNLLSNAIKFCRRGGQIRVFVPPGRPTTIAVQDDGTGLEPSMIEHLFRHDMKTTLPGTAGERGTGLGLPLSQDLMRALGGNITLESTSPQGSVFFANLPEVRPRVLVVGRDESLHLFVQPHLESIDAECLRALDDDDAVAKVQQGNVHLVIAETDLRANGGLSLLNRLREVNRGRAVPLMIVADTSEAGLTEQGFRMGADEIVVKPLEPSDFVVRLRRFIT